MKHADEARRKALSDDETLLRLVPDAWMVLEGPPGLAVLRERSKGTPDAMPYYTAKQLAAAVSTERERWAGKCTTFAKARLAQYQLTGNEELLHEATALQMVADAMRKA